MFTDHFNRRGAKARATLASIAACAALVAIPSAASASSGGVSLGGDSDSPTTSGAKAKLRNGYAIAPASAPARVKRAIDAANRIVKGKGYCLGGGHGEYRSSCYDCSGTVSYALGRPGARIIKDTMPSGPWASFGAPGKGKWITWYANSGHMFVVIAGLRLDTAQTKGDGPGWSRDVSAGFANVSRRAARHKGRL